MRVLVFGAGGFLGAATCKALEARGCAVVASSRTTGSPCDLSVPQEIYLLLDDTRPQTIVNCAVTADFTAGVLPQLYAVNSLAPAVMAEWAKRHDAYFVQASATLVLGTTTNHYTPQSPIAPDSDYGISKWLAEEMIQGSGCRSCLLRFGGLYGRTGPDHLGLNRAIRAALAGHSPILHGSGTGRRNYLHVLDAAEMIAACIQDGRSGVHLAGGPEIMSVADMLTLLADALLDGAPIERRDGEDSVDQIVETSPSLPPGRPMCEMLKTEL